MLAGLLFANHYAEDRADRLIATLPFAGSTLIEYQARQLVASGAAQLIVVAAQLTPDLLGAMSRIGRQGVAVDAVRSAGEAAEKLHPLARVVVIADGLVATDAAVAALTREGGDALLVVAGEEADAGFERVGGRLAWAGIARIQSQRVLEVASLPRDYDMQSALIRVAEQAGAVHLSLPGDLDRQGHGFAQDERSLGERGRRILASMFAGRRNWFDRWVVAPAAKLVLPPLVKRGVSAPIAAVAVGILAVIAGVALLSDAYATGSLAALAAALAAIVGETLSRLRGEGKAALWLDRAAMVLPLVAVVLLGWARQEQVLDTGPLVVSLAVAVAAGLAERAMVDRRPWWGSPAAYLVPVALGTLAGLPSWGLAIAALYATATLGAAIEDLRGRG